MPIPPITYGRGIGKRNAMKKYIVDASTTLKWIFNDEEGVGVARELLSDYLSEKIVLIAPSLWLIEVANAVKSAVLSGRIASKKGELLLSLLLQAKPKIIPLDGYVENAFKLACKYKISVYDGLYLTIALENKIPFVTADKKLFEAVKGLKEKVAHLNDFKNIYNL